MLSSPFTGRQQNCPQIGSVAQPVTQDLAISPLGHPPGQHLPSRLQDGCWRPKCHTITGQCTKPSPLVSLSSFASGRGLFLKILPPLSARRLPLSSHLSELGAQAGGEDCYHGWLGKAMVHPTNREGRERPAGK